MKSLLMWNHYITLPHTPKRFLDEYAGISAGSGLEYTKMIELNMLPEYTRAGCSIIGAWGKATGGKLVQLRALDWDTKNPMNKYPMIAVYNLNEKGSHPFINVGFTGLVGSITGFSEFTGVSEKVRKQNPVKQN
jgi:isopenicillin-N N-acyltransferase-like protein